MKPKTLILAGLATLGITTLALWMYQKVTTIELSPVSNEWIAAAEYNREGFRD